MVTPAGRRNRRILLERRRDVRTAEGQAKVEWDTLAAVWAMKETLAGSERFARQQVVAEATTRFTILWRPDVTPLHAVTDMVERRRYDVLEVLEVGNREELAIVGRARADGPPTAEG